MSVTAPQILCKQPWEKRKFRMYFTNLMDTVETISQIISINHERVGGDTSDLVISGSGVSSDGKYIEMWIENGTHKQRYRVEGRIQTSGQQYLEGDGLINITNH